MYLNKKTLISLSLVTVISGGLVACSTDPVLPNNANTLAGSQNWAIDPAQSSLTFVTTKAGQPGVMGIIETQTFKRFSGGLDKSGRISLVIDLASVDTGVEIRDERLRTMLWNVKATPQALFTAQLPANMTTVSSSAAMQSIDLAGQLQMAGQTKPVTSSLRVSKTAQGQLLVTTRQPILINSNDFGLKAGVEALREIMGLGFLAASAPVTFTLTLNPI
jgi:polyisoprenoid-binding protein YceI